MPSAPPPGDPLPTDGSLPAQALAELPDKDLAFYVHVPFCRVRCGYCDFNTYTASELPGMATSDYLRAAMAEIRLARDVLGDQAPPVSTIFFGGGTPTMLPAQDLARLVETVAAQFPLRDDVEITTEANPETVDPRYFAALRAAGFTRISLGLQSVVPHVLAALDRQHPPQRGLDAARWAAEAGFEHVSLDLIYGTPGESMADWDASLRAVGETPVDHVSAYALIVEEGTRLALRVRRGEITMPDDDEMADKYLMAEHYLAARGFANYEVSNWALTPQGRSRHNLHYWHGDNWWGIGPGAHSHVGGVRFWNRKHPRPWAEALAAGSSPVLAGEYLTDEQRRVERVLLELRLAEGLPLEVLHPAERDRVPGLLGRGLGDIVEGRLVLNVNGRLLADGVVRDLLEDL